MSQCCLRDIRLTADRQSVRIWIWRQVSYIWCFATSTCMQVNECWDQMVGRKKVFAAAHRRDRRNPLLILHVSTECIDRQVFHSAILKSKVWMQLDAKTKRSSRSNPSYSQHGVITPWVRKKNLLYCVKIPNVHMEMQYTRFREWSTRTEFSNSSWSWKWWWTVSETWLQREFQWIQTLSRAIQWNITGRNKTAGNIRYNCCSFSMPVDST